METSECHRHSADCSRPLPFFAPFPRFSKASLFYLQFYKLRSLLNPKKRNHLWRWWSWPHSSSSSTWFGWFSPQFPATSNSQTRARAIGMWSRRCTRLSALRSGRRPAKWAGNWRFFLPKLLTLWSRWKMTTRPPLSPVASNSPSANGKFRFLEELLENKPCENSTQEMMSAENWVDLIKGFPDSNPNIIIIVLRWW